MVAHVQDSSLKKQPSASICYHWFESLNLVRALANTAAISLTEPFFAACPNTAIVAPKQHHGVGQSSNVASSAEMERRSHIDHDHCLWTHIGRHFHLLCTVFVSTETFHPVIWKDCINLLTNMNYLKLFHSTAYTQLYKKGNRMKLVQLNKIHKFNWNL